MKPATNLLWLTIAFGLLASPVVAIGAETAKGTPLPLAVSHWIAHLFEPGYNEYLLVLITAFPFLAAAVFARFHLASEQASRGRWAGIAGALSVGAMLTLWILIGVRISRSSTASIGYIFMPFEVLLFMPFGYIAGRLVAKLRSA